ncbi:NADH-quinone oxidoreductase subunit J family protein [Ornithinicoccus halotolerans]|uniref:NADH-quinone oxidoreductase subunit J family protein n=1 Tax=Ornithinicoccus halotolerans TaxID=1748220 RepID=UPI0012976223|nr:NADH-quinone oxidoreductase subunit J [Ornithinicoccus halotolerans]
MTGLEVLFAAVGLLTAASAVLAVTAHRVLHAALWLVVALGGVAGCYLVLGAELVALVQLLVYVGAVVVLVLFALMLTREGVAAVDTAGPQRLLAGLVALAATVLLGTVLVAALGADRVPVTGASNTEVGAQLLGTWVWPFELLSLLLLAALVAAVAVATHRPPEAGEQVEHPEAELPAPDAETVGEQR